MSGPHGDGGSAQAGAKHGNRSRAARRIGAALVGLALLWAAAPASAVKIPLGLDGDDLTLNVGLLLQPELQLTNPALPSPNPKNLGDLETQFFLRRARIFLTGSVTKRITFFFDTDMPKFGQGGKFDQPFYIQDALMMVEYVKAQYIDAGFILVPFSHISLEGAAGLFALDYPSIVVKPPNNVGKAWRDMGAQLRGYLFDRRLQYRVGVFSGVDRGTAPPTPAPTGTTPAAAPAFALNPGGIPRFAAHVRFNILGRENDFFLKGIYFADKPLLSVGLGADYQRQATPSMTHATDYFALAADIFSEVPLSRNTEIILQGTYVHHKQGDTLPYANGNGFVVEAGMRWKVLSALFMTEYFHGNTDKHDQIIVHGGVNYWVRRHNANFKLDFAWNREGELASARDGYTGTLQGQLFF